MPDRMDDKTYRKKFEGQLPRGKWVRDPNEHADHDGQSLVTRNHDVIRQWAEERNAAPATVPGTEHNGHVGVLRFNFPEYGGRELRVVSWDDWFTTFDERNLVFLYQERLKNGNRSNFFKLNSPEREDG